MDREPGAITDKILDDRKQNWCWIDNEIIDNYGSVIGGLGVALYVVLSRYANSINNESYPSIGNIARKLGGLSRATVCKYLKILQENGLISIQRRYDNAGDMTSNLYTLLRVPMCGGSSLDELGSTASEPGVVQPVNYRSSLGEHKQELLNKNKLNNIAPPDGGGKPPPVTKPKKLAQPKPEPPPAIQTFRENASRYPPKAMYQDIDVAVGRDPPDIERWGRIVKAWVGMGWNPGNVNGMLEFFKRNEIPEIKGGNGRGQIKNNSGANWARRDGHTREEIYDIIARRNAERDTELSEL